MLLWPKIVVTPLPKICYGVIQPHNEPRNAVNSYYKHEVWQGYNELEQIPQWQYKDLFQYDSDASKLGLFLACWSTFPLGALSYW